MSDERQLQTSEEVDERHLELARRAGDAYREAVEHMIEEVAETGATTREGDYLLGLAQEEAEGMYRFRDGGLEWEEPAEDENCHLEVVVASAADGRFLPEIPVTVTLERSDGDDGETIGPVEVPFVWHPGLYHYGINLALPGEGRYDLTVSVEPAEFPRHDEENGDRFDEPAEARFEGVEIETGQS